MLRDYDNKEGIQHREIKRHRRWDEKKRSGLDREEEVRKEVGT